MGSLTAAAVRSSDFVLIPVQPSAADIWSAETVVDVCQSHGTPAAFVVSRAIVGTKEAGVAADALQSFDIAILEARTCQRIAYARAMRRGVSVLELSGADKAAAEVRALADEVLTYLPQRNE
jgi:chromosome partitioning protein